MSIERCQGAGCSNQIDTDFDVECVVEDPRHSLAGHPDLILCPKCRDRLLESQSEPVIGLGIIGSVLP